MILVNLKMYCHSFLLVIEGVNLSQKFDSKRNFLHYGSDCFQLYGKVINLEEMEEMGHSDVYLLDISQHQGDPSELRSEEAFYSVVLCWQLHNSPPQEKT